MTHEDAVDALVNAFTQSNEMEAWQDARDAAEAAVKQGAKTVEMPAALIHDVLRFSNPTDMPSYRDLWNRLCDEHGTPNQKIPTPEAGGSF